MVEEKAVVSIHHGLNFFFPRPDDVLAKDPVSSTVT